MHDKRTKENIRRNRGRRGAGLEMAMLLMLVTVALSGLLTSVAMMQIDKQKDSEEQLELLEQHMWLDRIGRDFCSQRASYVLPYGVVGNITYGYGTDGTEEVCPECCVYCAECNEKYAETDEDTDDAETEGNTDDAETEENTNDAGSDENNESNEGTESRPECCKDCIDCTIGCTQYTKISLVVRSDSGEVVLTVELTNNQDGTYTVTKWSYGE